MVRRKELYNQCTQMLQHGNIDSASFDVGCIFQEVFADKNIRFDLDDEASDEQAQKAISMTERYLGGYPLQYLLGSWEFYGYTFSVGEGVLIPRQDTETLVDFIISNYSSKHRWNSRLSGADLCAGSGCIGLTLEKKLGCSMMLAEMSEKAFEYLEKNAEAHESSARIFLADVLDENFVSYFSDFDFIVCNPPYLTGDDMQRLQPQVAHEPREALYGGEDGCDLYRSITRLWKNTLKPGGLLAFEIGQGQEKEVSGILIQHGFENVRFIKDYRGIFRVVYGFKPKQ